jgi:short-subunit dehydrogenase
MNGARRSQGRFAGRGAIVTGASSGIGRAVAFRLAQRGCRVGLMARRAEPLRELVAQINHEIGGGMAEFVVADVSDRSQVLAAARQLSDGIGPVDLLVAAAGIGLPDRLDPLSVDAIETLVRVNLLGVVYAIEAVLPEMLQRGHGHIAAVSSVGAYKGMPGSGGYCASKAAVNTLLEALRIELRGSGVAVTTICPGFVRTAMTAENAFYMPGLLEADEAGRRIVRALERRRKVYNFPWQTTLLMKLARRMPDALLARWLPRKGGADSVKRPVNRE